MKAELLREYGVPQYLVELTELADAVMSAAESVCISYRAEGGTTVPLHVNLRRLDNAVRVWQQRLAALQLDSDTNGFDRSAGWGEGSNSNEQSDRSAAAHPERWACRPSTGVGESQDEAPAAAPARPRRTRTAKHRA